MNRLLVGVVCALTGRIIATSAVGQGTGGTVGPAAVGTKTFEVRVKESNLGFNCVASKPRRCLRLRPRIANIFAGNGAVYDGSTRVGTAGSRPGGRVVGHPSEPDARPDARADRDDAPTLAQYADRGHGSPPRRRDS